VTKISRLKNLRTMKKIGADSFLKDKISAYLLC